MNIVYWESAPKTECIFCLFGETEFAVDLDSLPRGARSEITGVYKVYKASKYL